MIMGIRVNKVIEVIRLAKESAPVFNFLNYQNYHNYPITKNKEENL